MSDVDKESLKITERDENGIGKSYFPIEVRYEGSQEKVIVNHPHDLRDLVSFKVLRVRVGQ